MEYLNENATLIFHGKEYTYEAISCCINDIKERIMKCSTIKDAPVAIMMERVPNLIFSMMALLELSIPFVPIMLSAPEKRKNYMLSKAGVLNILCLDDTGDIIIKETELNDLELEKNDRSKLGNSLFKLAYILYTSGTTGKPKAVEVTREGLDNFINGIRERINFSLKERIGCFTNFTFDIFFLESIFALSQGMSIVLADENERKNPAKTLQLISRFNIKTIQMTPSGIKMLITCDENYSVLKNIKKFLIGGECFPENLLNELQSNTKAKIYNMYGPTETTIWSTVANLTTSENVHIGTPICNTEIKILDENLKEVNNGVEGEICILGKGVARGYCNDDEQTDKTFVILDTGERCYKTGDIGCRSKEGYFTCNGRRDNQIKLHGHRIELEEIEQVVLEMEGVLDVAACYSNLFDEKIVLFLMVNKSVDVDKKTVIRYLVKKLPQYMIPSHIVRIEKFIYNLNGKKDRAAILKSWLEQQKQPDVKQKKKGHWENVLSIIRKYVMDTELIITGSMSFNDIGIDSLTYIQLIADIEEIYGIEFEDEMLIVEAYDNLSSFALYIEKEMENVES